MSGVGETTDRDWVRGRGAGEGDVGAMGDPVLKERGVLGKGDWRVLAGVVGREMVGIERRGVG